MSNHLTSVSEGLGPTVNALASTEEIHPSHLHGSHRPLAESTEKEPEKSSEDLVEDVNNAKSGDILTSRYADWPRRALIKKFWRMYLLGVLVAFAGM